MAHLVLSSALWEFETDATTGQLAVDLRVGIESVINTSLLLLVKDNLQDLAAIFLGAETLADNLDWVDEVAEDGVVDGSECSGTGSLLGLRGSGSVASLWAGQDTAGGEDQDVTVGELLLEFTSETFTHVSTAFRDLENQAGRHTVAALCGSPEGMGRGQR